MQRKRKKKFECWFESLTPEYLVLQDLEPAAGEDLGTEALNWSWDLKEAEAGHMPSPVLLDWHAIPRFLLSDAAVWCLFSFVLSLSISRHHNLILTACLFRRVGRFV